MSTTDEDGNYGPDNVIEQQIQTIHDIGENATRMLRIALLSIAGIATGALTFAEVISQFTFPVHFCALLFFIFFVFLGISHLISGTLGVGASVERPHPSDGNIDEKIRTNEKIIRANKQTVLAADAFLSIGLAVITWLFIDLLYHVFLNEGILGNSWRIDIIISKFLIGGASLIHTWVPFITVIVAVAISTFIDFQYPPDHSRLDFRDSDGGGIKSITEIVFNWTNVKFISMVLLLLIFALEFPFC